MYKYIAHDVSPGPASIPQRTEYYTLLHNVKTAKISETMFRISSASPTRDILVAERQRTKHFKQTYNITLPRKQRLQDI